MDKSNKQTLDIPIFCHTRKNKSKIKGRDLYIHRLYYVTQFMGWEAKQSGIKIFSGTA